MKNQWPFWLFVVVIVIVVIFSLNYHGRNKVVSLGDIFPEGSKALDYEYVPSKGQTATPQQVKKIPASESQAMSAAATEKKQPQPVKPMPVKPVAVKAAPVKAAPMQAPQKKMVRSVASKTGAYTIQILSSKDQAAIKTALGRAKKNGFTNAYVQSKDLGSKGVWYRIYTGHYATITEAKTDLMKVKKAYPGAYILKP